MARTPLLSTLHRLFRDTRVARANHLSLEALRDVAWNTPNALRRAAFPVARSLRVRVSSRLQQSSLDFLRC